VRTDVDRALLETAPLTVRGRIPNSSNHTLLVTLDGGGDDEQVAAVYKPRAGERPLWDFPTGTLCQREVAAAVVSDLLGWGLVPPTVLRDGPLGEGSLQLFVPHDPRRHYFVLVDDERHHPALARLALFDLLVNNADRKASHVILAPDGRIVGCDHGLCFHPEPKLRTVVWELGGYAIPAAWRDDLRRLAATLAALDDAAADLRDLLTPREVAVLAERAAALASLDALPDVEEDLRPYPWPPL